jgi:cation diffusion facilitator CzcD-associated flavoprotein CzcO
MVQRSPGYVLALPGSDPIAELLRRLRLPEKLVYSIVRWKNVLLTLGFFLLSRRRPGYVRKWIRKGVKAQLPGEDGIDVDTHFNPHYDPWDQRVCLVPEGDLFRSFRRGQASIRTDRIETFTESGLELGSGEKLEADLIITATGLNLLAAGGIELAVDGREVRLPETVGYKGMMLSGVPNFAPALGYTNASWTLKCDLVAAYISRMLNHMDANGYDTAMPLGPGPDVPTEDFIDLKSGYVLRSIRDLPRQGARRPWRLHQNYPADILMLRYGSLEDEGIEFSRSAAGVTGGETALPVG